MPHKAEAATNLAALAEHALKGQEELLFVQSGLAVISKRGRAQNDLGRIVLPSSTVENADPKLRIE